MYIKSFGSTLLLLIASLFTFNSAFSQSQETIRFKVLRAEAEDDAIFHQQFKSYTLATLSTETISNLLRSKEYFSSLSLAFNDQTFDFTLMAHDIRDANYALKAITDNGTITLPRSPNKTYFGYTKGSNYDVRITCDEDCFYGLIVQEHDELYIEPARKFVPGLPKNQFVLYWKSDNLRQFGESMCSAQKHPEHAIDPEAVNQQEISDPNRARACKTVQIALADDHLMFDAYGSVADVEDHNMAVINNVLTNYDFEFADDFQFTIMIIFVATSAGNDPWSTSNNPNTLLNSFTTWGPSGFGVTHDVASLWSNRDFTGDVIGLAWLEAICTNFKYNVLEDFTSNANFLRVLQAHEMGHNFGADHDPVGSNTIMGPSVTNTNTWSATSITAINNYVSSVNCLAGCSPPAPPVANFTADPTNGCAPLSVFYDDLSTNNPTSWSWSFPGGSPATSAQQNPVINYNTPGTYNVTLTVSNSQGSNTKTITNFITVSEEPFADFDYTVNENVVDFENLSEFATSYFWNFGDGNTSTQVNPSHDYDEDGFYQVTLTATNSCGSDQVSFTIEIITLPFADFDADEVEGCNPFEVHFYNYSSANATDFAWSFPGGSPPTSTQFEPDIVYEIPGTYNVTLTASNAAGDDVYVATGFITVLPQPNATFTTSGSGLAITFNSAGSIADTYLWNFGDGLTSTLANPVHVYAVGGTYTVTLSVTNECGTDAFQQTINVTGAPAADFTSDVESGCAPLVVHFMNTSAGTPTGFSWLFEGGNPATSNVANPTVTYNTPGTWDVSLTVTNISGNNTITLTDFIEVYYNTLSDFDYTVNGLQSIFTNQSQHSTGSLWLFGDGQQSTQNNPVHVYNQDGTYTVMLISSGVCGPDTSTAQVTISTPPQASFSVQQSDFCIPASVAFVNESSNNATSFLWTFEGGSPASSTQENPLVTYATPGTYDVQLIAYSGGGNDTFEMNNVVTIGDVPDAAFLLATEGTTVNLENQTTNADSYIWLFDDGQSSTEENPSHTYDNFGTYELLLIAINECGADSQMVVIELGTVPNAFFGWTGTNIGCAPFQVQFIDQSQNTPTQWFWTFEGGDPATSEQQNPLVTYNTPGQYLVSLTVTNGQGTDALVLDDLIEVAGQPDATFNYNQVENLVSLEYLGTDYDSLHWDFGNGQSDNSLNPTVTYTADGVYKIELIVFNACGSDTTSVAVTVDITGTVDPELLQGNWQVRPNPFNDILNLIGEPTTDGEMKIILRDLAGRLLSTTDLVYTQGQVIKQIEVGNLASGLYLVELRTERGATMLRAVHQQ